MSARQVADLLALAHEGMATAQRTGDEHLAVSSRRLAAQALAHPSAGTFFAGLQVALAEEYASDARRSRRDVRTGGANALTPADAGSIPHDGLVREEDDTFAERFEPVALVHHRGDAPVAAPGEEALRRAAKNLRR